MFAACIGIYVASLLCVTTQVLIRRSELPFGEGVVTFMWSRFGVKWHFLCIVFDGTFVAGVVPA